MIQLDRVKRQFGPRVLFEALSWRIPERARLGLIGPNGTGKTTLLRLLAGRETPDAGDVHRPRRLQVGYLPQEVESIETGSVLDVALAGSAEVRQLEQELASLEQRLAGLEADDPRSAELTERYGQLRERYEHLDGDRAEARARAVLSGLGVPEARFDEPVETLSGGWRMRVVLARMLLGEPGLLLLDEPTNHLDLEAIGWLEEFLAGYEGAFVVVSHDRYFLNRMVEGVVELERGELTHFPGSYDDYLEEKEARRERLEKTVRQQARERAKVERFIERFRYKNTKARQVQSRIKALERVERVEVEVRASKIHFGFPPAPRSGDMVVRAEDLVKRYGDLGVYDGMNLQIRRGARVALVGPNGAGKSTLLKLVAGTTPVDGGRLELGHNVQLYAYAQHQLEALDPAATVLEEAERSTELGDRPRVRKLLGCFLFTGDQVDKRVAVLSGGEKARLALCKMLLRPANLLLLDEPTNHLDLASREVLEDALNEYQGTLIVISHDRYFINRVATSIAEVGGGRIELYDGDYDEYHEWKHRRELALGGEAVEQHSPPESHRERQREQKRQEAEERNRRYRDRQAVQKRLAPLEQEIADTERRIGELEAMQANPAVYSNAERAAETGREKAAAEAQLGRLYAEWEAVAAEFETDA